MRFSASSSRVSLCNVFALHLANGGLFRGAPKQETRGRNMRVFDVLLPRGRRIPVGSSRSIYVYRRLHRYFCRPIKTSLNQEVRTLLVSMLTRDSMLLGSNRTF